MLRLCLFMCLCAFVQFSEPQVILTCSANQDGDQTSYLISDLPHVSELTNCEYTWANASRHMVAHNDAGSPDLVVVNSIKTLVTSRCISKMFYTMICYPGGDSHTVECLISCGGNAWPQGYNGLVAIVVISFAIVLGIIIFLLYKLRLIHSTCCSERGL